MTWSWEFNLNTVTLLVVLVLQLYKVSLHRHTRDDSRANRDMFERLDKAVRENLGVVTNYTGIVTELVKGYHHLTEGTVADAKETMTNLASAVKETAAASAQASLDVAVKLAADTLVASRGEVQ